MKKVDSTYYIISFKYIALLHCVLYIIIFFADMVCIKTSATRDIIVR